MPFGYDFRSARIWRRLTLGVSLLLLFFAAVGTIFLIERHFGPARPNEREMTTVEWKRERKIVHFLRGHGERTPDRALGDGGLGRLCRWIWGNGWQIETIDGARIGELSGPDSLLLVLDPLLPLNSQERIALRALLEERGGRILLLLTAQSHPALGEFLRHWNVAADPPDALPAGPDGEIWAADPNGANPLPVWFPSLRTLRENSERPAGDRFSVRELLRADGSSVAVSVRNRYGPTTWELVAVGGDFLDNGHFALAGNRQFFQKIFCRLLGDRPPEQDQPEEFQLHMDSHRLARLAVSCLTMPLLFMAFFLLIRLLRRS
ncbi:MAG: hypothetical protein LBH53_01510 [Puniceicoccales bacterium]|nr:hypothetical protein [Puniceicoccales bacterium]